MSNWIRMRVNLEEDPNVLAIAKAVGREPPINVIQLLWKFWSWADQHTISGRAPVTMEWVDDLVKVQGFAAAMESQDWLRRTTEGIFVPHHERYLGNGSKQRALTLARVQRFRAKQRNAPRVTPPRVTPLQPDEVAALPEERRLEERRGDNGDPPPAPAPDVTPDPDADLFPDLHPPKPPPPTPRETIPPSLVDVQEAMAARGVRNARVEAEKFIAHYESNGWKVGKNPMKRWRMAVVTWSHNLQVFSGGGAGSITGAPRPTSGYDAAVRQAEAARGKY